MLVLIVLQLATKNGKIGVLPLIYFTAHLMKSKARSFWGSTDKATSCAVASCYRCPGGPGLQNCWVSFLGHLLYFTWAWTSFFWVL